MEIIYIQQVLRSWKEYELAIVTINYGKRLLDSSQSTSPCVAGDGADEVPEDEVPSFVGYFLFS